MSPMYETGEIHPASWVGTITQSDAREPMLPLAVRPTRTSRVVDRPRRPLGDQPEHECAAEDDDELPRAAEHGDEARRIAR